MIDEAKRNHDHAQQLRAYKEQKLATAAAEAHEVLVQARRDAAAAGEKSRRRQPRRTRSGTATSLG